MQKVTAEMNENIRAHYRSQGATAVDLIESECGALVPFEKPATFLSMLLGDKRNAVPDVRWRRWKLGNGFIATCNLCHSRGEFEEVTRAGKKNLRFRHCGGRIDKLPLLLRWIF